VGVTRPTPPAMIDLSHEPWWKTAVVYCLDVETFFDADGDGIGDFEGLRSRLDYLAELGVTCLWLMPFYPTSNRDDGYDVLDHYGIDPRLGDFGDFTELVTAAHGRGIRVVADLVVNHTSSSHPWFQAARSDPGSRYVDYYVWQDEPPADWKTSLVFPGEQTENWTFDEEAGRYYLHHFYRHQPDLNPDHPAVRREIRQMLSFWAQLGLSGFRVDAVPFLVELAGIEGQLEITPHGFLKDLAAHLGRRRGDAVMLGEVNLEPKEQVEFFGAGDELDMMFNFYVNQYLHLALARRDARPLREALEAMPPTPPGCRWAIFVTNHDELTLDKLTDDERREVFEAFAPDESMRLYGRGIRRRLPSMLEGDEQRLRMVYSLMFSLPGTPVLFYGEEIGMSENLDIPGRGSVRTPMQWGPGPAGGFSSAHESQLIRRFPDGPFGPGRVNVADQSGDSGSLLEWMRRLIRARRATPELTGDWRVHDAGVAQVTAIRYDLGPNRIHTFHNFGSDPITLPAAPHLGGGGAETVWGDGHSDITEGKIGLAGDGYLWLRTTGVEG
jgi:trehalose synthase